MRELKGFHKYLFYTIAFFASVYHLYIATFGSFTPRLQRPIHLIFLLPLAFLLYPSNKNSPKQHPSFVDYFLAFLTLLPNIYIILNHTRLENRWELASPVFPIEVILGIIFVILIIEIIRRAVAPALAVIVGISVVYLIFGNYLPRGIAHSGFSYFRCVELLYLINDEGIYGSLVGVSSNYVAVFILFGAFLIKTGISEFFSDFARAFAGSARGGPAKIAVISSSLFGTVSGIAVANVFATGTFTIPLMLKRGYRPTFAGAVEAAASTGGQYLPPVMGAAAFVMAEMLAISYVHIILAAALSGILFYFALFHVIDVEAKMNNLEGENKKDLPHKKEVFKKIYLFLPLLVLLFLLVKGYSPIYAGVFCIYFSIIIGLTNPEVRKRFFKFIFEAMIVGAKNTILIAAALAGTGMVVSVIIHTALGIKFARLVITLSGGNLIITMVLIAISALILGTGVPTVAAYILSVTLGGRALIELGVLPIAAHLFCFYYAIIACITPPVALCAYAASSISKSDPMKTGFEAFKLGIAGFIIPFMFVFYPGLLLRGTLFEIVISTIITIFVVLVSVAFVKNYLYNRHLHIIERILLLVVIILLVNNNYYFTFIGFVIFFIYLVLFILKGKLFTKKTLAR